MARGSGDSLLTVALLGVGGYLVYQWFQQHPGGITTGTITPQTYAAAPPMAPGQVFIGPPSPTGTTGSTTAPSDTGGIVMGPGY